MSKIEGMDRAMVLIKERAYGNELDYRVAMDCLKEYASPRAKLSRLLQSGALLRIRKGLYLLGPKFQHRPYCLELLGNLIYGPSYVSLERALFIYGMIPEHVEAITSVTIKPSKEFRTPVGNFLYAHCHPKSYSVGVTSRPYGDHENPFIATPEKALTDVLTIKRGKVTSMHQLEEILLEDLRVEESDLLRLDLSTLRKIYAVHPHSAIFFLEKWLSHHKGVS